MTARGIRTLGAVAVAALTLAGCTGGGTGGGGTGGGGGGAGGAGEGQPGELRLAAFDSCDQALGDLRQALLPRVGAYGLAGDGGRLARDTGGATADAMPGPPGAAAEQGSQPPQHSTTNTHEAGVDEPDLVKTDGRRIVTVADGSLRVLDAASRTQTGTLALPQSRGMDQLLLAGDHALVVRRGGFAVPHDVAPAPDRSDAPLAAGSELLLVDLAGAPRVLATFGIDGSFVDARMVGRTVRVVSHSQPRLGFVHPTDQRGEAEALRTNRDVVARSPIEDWLPRYRLEQGGSVRTGRVDCASVARPARYSATSMLTVLTFDLGADTLGTGDPVTIVADGDVVYGTAQSLYVASAGGWSPMPRGGPDLAPGGQPQQERTELYKFDIAGTERPRHVASGSVPGSLLNQYSMSEHDGHLRVATTLGGWNGGVSESAVYALAQRGDRLTVVGQVGGLGRDERIYSVRFVGPVGYVVTFRQTDPLYVLDLRDPASPKVTGELKITGYSAYLHPLGDGRVLGVGQEASEDGRVQGSQVSLFDVSDPAAPRRVAQYHLPGGSSEAEFDPHAFLYWAPARTLVLPVATYTELGGVDGGAVVLRVGDAELAETGRLRQPVAGGPNGPVGPQPIRRALVVGDTLWTVSEYGAAAVGLTDLGARGWVAFDR